MQIKYNIYREEGLLIQKFYGNFSIDRYLHYSQFISTIPEANNIQKVLIDFRDIDFEGLSEDPSQTLDKIIDVRKKINRDVLKRTNIKHIIWVDKPLPTAIIHIFMSNFPDLDYSYCTTLEMVQKSLNLPAPLINLEEITSNLENRF
jgi:hypothetical protein